MRFTIALLAGALVAGAMAQVGAEKVRNETVQCSPIDSRDIFPQIDNSVLSRLTRPENPKVRGTSANDPVSSPIRLGNSNGAKPVGQTTRYPGIDFTGYYPPDTSFAVGTNHTVLTVNVKVAYYNKSTGAEVFNQNLTTFFSGMGVVGGLFDPKVMYDSHSGRFVLCVLEEDDATQSSYLLMAVSDDGDPNGTWYRYRIDSEWVNASSVPTWMDYPGMGGNAGAFVVCGNQFGYTSGYYGFQFICMNKTPMLTGAALTVAKYTVANGSAGHLGYSLEPCETLDASQLKMVCAAHTFGSGGTSNKILFYTIASPGGASPSFSYQTVTVPSYALPGVDARSTNARTLDSMDGRLINAVYRGNKIVTAHTINAANPLAVRWYEFNYNTGTNAITLDQSGNITGGTDDHHMAAISKNAAGDIGVVCSRSNTNLSADIYMYSRKSSDAVGTMTGSNKLHDGGTTRNYSLLRWGDYAAVCADPSDNGVLWAASMAVDADNMWHCYFFKQSLTTAQLNTMTLNQSYVEGGTTVTGTVNLTAAAPAGGAVVTLSSNNGSATVPASVTVPAAAVSTNFNVNTTAPGSIQNATISATYLAVTRTQPLAVYPLYVPTSFNVSPSTIAAGGVVTGTVIINNPAPAGGITINITESTSFLSAPASVNIAMANNNASFPIQTYNPAASITVAINVTRGATTITRNITVTPLSMTSFTLSSNSIYGGTNVTGTVNLSVPAPVGLTIPVSDNSASVTSPAPMTFVTGNTSGTFTLVTYPTATTHNATISVSKHGQTLTQTLQIMKPVLNYLAMSSTNVLGGSTLTATPQLLGKAYTGGIVVSLSSTGPEMVPPASATILYGTTQKSVVVTTTVVASTVNRNLNATFDGVTKTRTVTIHP